MWAKTDDLAPIPPERGFSLAQFGLGACFSLTSYGRETPMISRRSADDLGSLHVWPHLNNDARVPVCGLVSGYNGAPGAPDHGVHELLMSLIVKRVRLQSFLNADHVDTAFATFEAQVREWLDSGQPHAPETVVEGLDQAPEAFVGLFKGHNIGKLLVKLEASQLRDDGVWRLPAKEHTGEVTPAIRRNHRSQAPLSQNLFPS